MTIELLVFPAVIGLMFISYVLIHAIHQLYSYKVYGKWLAHPLAEKAALLEALLTASEQQNASLKTKLEEQDSLMQEVYATLMKKIGA